MLKVRVSEQTGEILMDLFGKLQIEILRDTLAERFGVKAEFSGMKTICREKPVSAACAEIRMGEKKEPAQSGNRNTDGTAGGWGRQPV